MISLDRIIHTDDASERSFEVKYFILNRLVIGVEGIKHNTEKTKLDHRNETGILG